MNQSRWKQLAIRSLLLGLLLTGAGLLSGCQGTLYQDKITMPGTNFGVEPLHLVIAFLIFGLFGPATTIVLIWLLRPYIFPPFYKTKADGIGIEVWVSQRRYPLLAFADALVVPVAPDLKMVFGAAKIARDTGAGTIQNEANLVAPLAPGDAFVGTGSRYKFKHTVLAVIFDESKRTSPELINTAVRRAMELVAQRGAVTACLADMTENLQSQPNWITDTAREDTARATARLMIDAILGCKGTVDVVKIWVFDPKNGEIFSDVLEEMADQGKLHAHPAPLVPSEQGR